MFYFWAKLSEVLGLWKATNSSFTNSLMVATLMMLTYVSSAFLVRKIRKTHYFCSKDNPVDKSGLVAIVIFFSILLVAGVCYLTK